MFNISVEEIIRAADKIAKALSRIPEDRWEIAILLAMEKFEAREDGAVGDRK